MPEYKPLTFVHAADFHLGADLKRFGPAAEKLRQAQFNALYRTLACAAEIEAAFVVICGDLFDSRFPAEKIIEQTRDVFAEFPLIKVFIIPGTHDFLSRHSILSSEKAGWASKNVILLNQSVESPLRLPDFNCHLYFTLNRSNRSSSSPVNSFCRQSHAGYHIGLAHGSLRIGGLDLSYDFPIEPKEIEESCLDYLALGHWHRVRVEKYGRTTVAYSGIPQPLSFSDPEEGSALVVTIGGSNPEIIEQMSTSTIIFKRISEVIYHPHQLTKVIDNEANTNKIIKLDLQFSDNLKEHHEIDRIIKNSASRFLSVNADGWKEKNPSPELEDINRGGNRPAER
jgi:DNA repair exonuclease SbcCD nuclease subunit